MKLAILDDYQRVAETIVDWSELPDQIELKVFTDHLHEEGELVARLKDFQILMGMRERTPFPRSLLAQLPELRLLITTGDHNASFDLEAATEMGIVVGGTGAAGEGPAELTWGLILGLLRHIPQEDRLTRQGNWGTTVGSGLKGRTLGLVGLGHIGARMARVAHAFEMNVIAWSQNLTGERAAQCGSTLVDKETLLRESDIVSIHVRLGPRSRGLIGAAELTLMKPSAYLVNTSRGQIVEEQALIDALEQGTIAGAALDTFDIEPIPTEHPFLRLPNTVLTPHVGYVTQEAYQAYYTGVVTSVQAFTSGAPVKVLNPEVLESPQLRVKEGRYE
ncbi:MAG: D-2-hydroxyacid dehydrogenase family protein [Acidobacteriota bacterium]